MQNNANGQSYRKRDKVILGQLTPRISACVHQRGERNHLEILIDLLWRCGLQIESSWVISAFKYL